MTQSRYWTDTDGFVNATRADGTVFRANPLNIGVESELYTRFGADGSKDTTVEDWFAEAIDRPASKMIDHLLDPSNTYRLPFQGDPKKSQTAKILGFRVNHYVDRIRIPSEIRRAIASYIAALLVRHPKYLAKLKAFHQEDNYHSHEIKGVALDNMLNLYQLYTNQIAKAVLLISRREGSSEYIYADGGIMVEEPWRTEYGVPFDIHAPLTPDIALQVLPIPFSNDLDTAAIMESNNQGTSRLNRIILGGAERFVFSRQSPPVKFIVNNFGKPAPKNIGYSLNNGQLDTCYDPRRS